MTTPAASPRNRARDAWAVAALVLAGLATVVVIGRTWYQLSMDCRGYDDEGIVRAPRSWQGRFVCSDGGYGDPRVATLSVLAIVLWVAAVTVWVRTRRVRWLIGLLVAAVVSPVLVAAVVTRLPADCNAAQRQHYGEHGCERDVEMILE